MNSKNQTTWINLSLERPLISCLSKRSYNPSLKSLPPADFFREVTHVKHFLFQSSRWSTEQNTKDDFGSIFQHRLIYHLLVVMYFLIKIYLTQPATSTTTCSGRKPFSLEGAKRENQEKVIREQRELQAGIPWNNEGAERTGPVEHDERLCPGVSIRSTLNLFLWLSSLTKNGTNFSRHPSMFQALIRC